MPAVVIDRQPERDLPAQIPRHALHRLLIRQPRSGTAATTPWPAATAGSTAAHPLRITRSEVLVTHERHSIGSGQPTDGSWSRCYGAMRCGDGADCGARPALRHAVRGAGSHAARVAIPPTLLRCRRRAGTSRRSRPCRCSAGSPGTRRAAPTPRWPRARPARAAPTRPGATRASAPARPRRSPARTASRAPKSRVLTALAGNSGATEACQTRVLMLSGTASSLSLSARATLRGGLDAPWTDSSRCRARYASSRARVRKLARAPAGPTRAACDRRSTSSRSLRPARSSGR